MCIVSASTCPVLLGLGISGAQESIRQLQNFSDVYDQYNGFQDTCNGQYYYRSADIENYLVKCWMTQVYN